MESRTSLKSRSVIAILFLLSISLVLIVPAAIGGEVTMLVKPAQIKFSGKTVWRPLKLHAQVKQGDAIRTGRGGRVEISITPHRQIRISEASEIVVQELKERPGGMRADINLLVGRFWGSVRDTLKKNRERLNIRTATATIGVKGTSFGVDFDKENKIAQVAVVKGEVTVGSVTSGGPPKQVAGPREIAPPEEVSREEWTQIVARDQKLILRPDQAPRLEPLTQDDKEDPWIKFNTDRDRS